jgi:hypothetical protein
MNAGKYAITVTVTATFTYTVEVDAQSAKHAADLAESPAMLAEHLPSDFQVARDYCEFATEEEQLTAMCPRCDAVHDVPHASTSTCACASLGRQTGTTFHGNAMYRPHLNDGQTCTPAPWWYEDQDYCHACGELEEAKYAQAMGVQR